MKIITKIIFFVILISQFMYSTSEAARKALWVWDTDNVVGTTSSENILLNECLSTGITDIYLYCPSGKLTTPTDQLKFQNFISRMSCLTIRVWGMDGWRGYFSDMCGPSDFYDGIQDVINYNSVSKVEERFFGFHGDNEFQAFDTDCGSVNAFHYGIKDINLSTTGGSGQWKNTEKQDRDSLMADFVKQTLTASTMCHNAGMEYGIAIMSWVTGVNWTHNAIGAQTTPLYATYNGTTKPLFHHLMDYVDEYVIMSYHTNVSSKVTLMCKDELLYADGLPVLSRPRILSALETFCGVAQYVSYCDTPGEDSKSHVVLEMALHTSLLGTYSSFSGIAIHDWTGWRGLSPVSNNTATPNNSGCIVASTKSSATSGLAIQLFPNPGENILSINYPEEFLFPREIKIYNGMGVEVLNAFTVASNQLIEINTESWPSGIYLIDFIGQKRSWVKK